MGADSAGGVADGWLGASCNQLNGSSVPCAVSGVASAPKSDPPPNADHESLADSPKAGSPKRFSLDYASRSAPIGGGPPNGDTKLESAEEESIAKSAHESGSASAC